MRPHRRQPNRLPRPWDSPGKNKGVGCHFLLQCMKVKSESEVAQSCPILSDPMDCSLPTRLLHPWDFPGKSTGVGCHCLLQLTPKVKKNVIHSAGIFVCPTFCDYSPSGSSVHGILQARILEWEAIPLSRGSSQLRDQTWVSYIAGRFFTI